MKSSKINRRKFIQYSAAVSSGVVIVTYSNSCRFCEKRFTTGPVLVSEALRILQTVLREPDAKDYDAAAVVAYMEKSGSNTLVVNGGGIVDFFQNPLPGANINSLMGNRMS